MNQLLKNFSWGSAGTIYSTLIRAVTLALLARLLAPSEFAVYASAFGVLTVGKAIADLGLTKFAIRDRAIATSQDPNTQDQLYTHALKLNIYSSFTLGVGGFLSFLGAWALGVMLAIQLLPMAISTALEKNADTWRAIHVADGKTRLRSLDLIARRTLCLLLFFLLTITETLPPIVSLTISEAVAALISLLAVRFYFRGDICLPDTISMRPVLTSARPFWVNSLSMSSRTLDVAVVSAIAPLTQSGFFAVAARLVGPLQAVPASLASVVLPHIARASAVGRSRAVHLPIYTALASIPVCILLSSLAPPLVPYLLGDAYTAGILCIQLIILGMPLSIYFNLTISVLQGQGYETEVSRVSVVFGLMLIPSVAVGAYLGGANGAAVGTVCANSAFALLVYLVRRKARF